ncbi:RsmB/NOP family class I SAM-dependent RNA methyltransferase [Sphingomicrobium sediminis]|uniref:RsmB/NOP family class I SAM-dependent RNA methyltransferase n=1 Tax=Sphingomicrobium sediminis TaxID=2950949 RepID=A0A9X2J174_9SPHN|nr:RsmB/NOP family class I SAM-dependent RNA methyltransferase [Sphingomicrobium sediminis]MCM8556973.1 RsmB/NOP family class I SAM-dependent RNA methyltransferase [Sphingomicrobium sediminis]
MRPAARVQAAIEILDAVIASAREGGAPADALIRDYFRSRRYAGSKDRRAVRGLVYDAIRRHGDMPASGRAAMLGLAQDDPELAAQFDGSEHGPAPIAPDEPILEASNAPQWVKPLASNLVGDNDWPSFNQRAPLDLRVNLARTDREAMVSAFEGAELTPFSPMGLRLPTDSRVDDHAAYQDGLVEVQDEASQLVAMACRPATGQRIVDFCAGAGGKSLALAALAPEARIIAADTDKRRLSALGPRAERAGAAIETRLMNQPNELAAFEDGIGRFDTVLVDAPCSGSGTWRRSPELRWRLNPERLERLVGLQRDILDKAAQLVRPGGTLVYAVCSIIEREGAAQAADFESRHSGWMVQDALDVGRSDGPGRLLTPAHDGTDGFFIASWRKG